MDQTIETISCPVEVEERNHDESEVVLEHVIYQCTNCSAEFDSKWGIENLSCSMHRTQEMSTIEHIEFERSDEQHTNKVTVLSEVKLEPVPTDIIVNDFIAENTLKFICSYCKASFSSRRSLKLHFNSKKCMQQWYECDYCQKVFIKKRYLLRHLQRMHQSTTEVQADSTNTSKLDDKKKHKCHLCPKLFTMTSSLKDHLCIHTGERPFLCAFCGKGFTQNSNLRQHLMCHNQDKPFKCVKCSAHFVSKGELIAHNRTHTGEHPFTCDICNTGFTTCSSLVKHRRIHSGERPYQCDLCPLRFAALGTLKNHRRTHTGEKPFLCGICNKAFSQRTDCILHLRTVHSDEGSYECEQCEMKFRHSSSLKAHTKNRHSEKMETSTT